mgnify:CR=1 FL=1|jgi:hypothetical protein
MMDQNGFLAIAENGTSNDIFSGLEAWVLNSVGAVIFSGSTFDLATSKSRRIFTNQPDIYPVSGLKEIVPNAWTAQVLDRRQTFVANSLAEIRGAFPDHAVIASLGCGSVINMPVFLAGQFLGTVNVLHEPDHYAPDRVAKLHDLRPAAMLAFASHALGLSADHPI